MVGHATNTNLNRPSSSDIEIALTLEPVALSIDFFNAVSQAVDPNWILYRRRYFPDAVVKSWTYVDKVLPMNGKSKVPLAELWLRPADLQARFTSEWLG